MESREEYFHPHVHTANPIASENRSNWVNLTSENFYIPRPRYTDRQLLGYSVEQEPGYTDRQLPGYSVEQEPVYPDRQPPGYSVEQQPGYPDKPPGYSVEQEPGYPDRQPPGYSVEQEPGYPDRQPPGYSVEQQPGYPDRQPPGYSVEQQPGYSDRQLPGYSVEQQPGYPDRQSPGYSDKPPPSYSLVFDTRSNACSHDYTEQRSEQSGNGRISTISGRLVTEQTPTEFDRHEENAGFSTDPRCQERHTENTGIPPHDPVSQTRRYLPIISEVNTGSFEQSIIPLPTDPDHQVTHTAVNTSSPVARQGLNRQQRTDTENNTQLSSSKCTSICLICFAFVACLMCLITGILALYFVWRRHKFLSAGQNKEALKSQSAATNLIFVSFIIFQVWCIIVFGLTGIWTIILFILSCYFFFVCCCTCLHGYCQKLILKSR